MNEPIRRTLIDTKVSDIEVHEDYIIFYLINEHGACYAVQIESGKSSVDFFCVEDG